MNNGLNEKTRKDVASGLSTILADTYTLNLKTLNFHWNLVSPRFSALHSMFETQYGEMTLAIDDLAERIRALGFFAPASLVEFKRLTSIKDEEGVPETNEMITQLLEGHEVISKKCREMCGHAQELHDEVSADMLIGRMKFHEKTAWMLRSSLQETK
ncbi:MAG: Dps family protein [Bacteriovoracaceae bacterium]